MPTDDPAHAVTPATYFLPEALALRLLKALPLTSPTLHDLTDLLTAQQDAVLTYRQFGLTLIQD